jgi:hypothetical protein
VRFQIAALGKSNFRFRSNYTSAKKRNYLTELWVHSQWQHGLRCGSAAALLLGLWVRIPPGAWMSVSCECCVLSGRGLCDGLVPRPKESYRARARVTECDHEASKMRRPRPTRAVEPWKKRMGKWS